MRFVPNEDTRRPFSSLLLLCVLIHCLSSVCLIVFIALYRSCTL